MSLDVEEEDGKTLARLDDLEEWEDNPRDAEDQEIERLADEIEGLGQYKPLIVDLNEGVIIGGNMRSRALRLLIEDDDREAPFGERAWVSLVDAADEQTRLEYAFSDNDRVGHYDREAVADLVLRNPEIDISDYKVDFYAPTDITQDLARAMDPEDLEALIGDEGGESDEEDGGEGEAGAEGDDDAEEGEPEVTPRSMEALGEQSSTAMVQLFMSQADKDALTEDVKVLKGEWGLETTSDVVVEAVGRAAEEAEVDEEELVEADD